MPDDRPYFPVGVNLVAWCHVERRKGGKRWDLGGLVEALKPAFDGLEGIVYANDSQVVGVMVEWDRRPTGTGVVVVNFVEAPQ